MIIYKSKKIVFFFLIIFGGGKKNFFFFFSVNKEDSFQILNGTHVFEHSHLGF